MFLEHHIWRRPCVFRSISLPGWQLRSHKMIPKRGREGKHIQSEQKFSSVQLLSRVQLFAIPWTAAHQASLSIAKSWSLLKLMSTESVVPSNISSSVVPFSSHLQSFPAHIKNWVPENIMLSEISQLQKDKYCIFYLYDIRRIGKFLEIVDSRLPGTGERKGWSSIAYWLQSFHLQGWGRGRMKKIWKQWWWLHTIMNVINATKSYT